MDFWAVIKKRRSVRSFVRDKAVTEEQAAKIIEAGKLAPSAGGIYPVEFITIRDEKTKAEMAQAARGQRHVAEASVVIVVVADLARAARRYGQRGRELYAIQDAAAAVENMLLAATALGLGACWIGAFSEEEVSEILDLRRDKRPLTLLPIGWEK